MEAPTLAGVAVGCDVVEVARLSGLLDRRPAARTVLFSVVELADAVRDGVGAGDRIAIQRLAARFAAKEAVVKLLRRPRLAWTDVEIRSRADGSPTLLLDGEPMPVAVSLSHDGGLAMAAVAATDDALASLLERVATRGTTGPTGPADHDTH